MVCIICPGSLGKPIVIEKVSQGGVNCTKWAPNPPPPHMAILQSPEWPWGRNRMRQEVITTKSPEQRWSNFSTVLTSGCSLKSDATLTVEILISKIKIYAWEDYCAVVLANQEHFKGHGLPLIFFFPKKSVNAEILPQWLRHDQWFSLHPHPQAPSTKIH